MDKQDEPVSNALVDHADLQDAVIQDQELREDDTANPGERGLGLNATQARAEGMGSQAGSAQLSACCVTGDDGGDGGAGGGYLINNVQDRSYLRRTPIDPEEFNRTLLPLIRRLTDVRQAQIMVLLHGLGGEKKHTFAEVGAIHQISGQMVAKIEEAALRNISNMQNPEMRYLFEEVTR